MGVRGRIEVIGLIAFFVLAMNGKQEPVSTKSQQLENCLRFADYIGRGKVASCKTTAQLGATASMSYANSFITCIDQLDRLITTNRDACHKKYQK